MRTERDFPLKKKKVYFRINFRIPLPGTDTFWQLQRFVVLWMVLNHALNQELANY